MIRVLYICPFAHYSGHHPHVATVEPGRLAKSGLDVTLLTFEGIINNADAEVRHIRVLPQDKLGFIHKVFKKLRYKTLPRWFVMFVETTVTLIKASWLMRKGEYDVLHLRDGEPFIFLSHLVSLPYRGQKWAISLTAAIVFSPKLKLKDFMQRPFVCLYAIALNIWVNNRLWWPIYKLSMRRNKFMFMPQNQVAAQRYKEYMGGVFKSNVRCIEWGIDNNNNLPGKQESREHLGIPLDAFVLLSFGAPHSGKDTETIFKAVQQCPDAFLIHGGTHTFSLGSNPVILKDNYGLSNRAKIFNYYIPEDEKPYFFSAADVLILSYTKAFASTSSMIWEAAKYRLPVISSNANTLGKDVKRYKLGLLFEAEDAISLVGAINRYKNLSESELAEIKASGLKFVTAFSDAKWAKNCTAVYRGLMNGSNKKVLGKSNTYEF